MSTELGTDVFEKENEEDETATKFDAKKNFDKDIWKELSDSVNAMINDCAYTGRPESHLNINTADVVVGGRQKKNQGKGYRAFLNTIMQKNILTVSIIAIRIKSSRYLMKNWISWQNWKTVTNIISCHCLKVRERRASRNVW